RAIVEIATWLGHYVGDVHVPFHAVANYDGQLSGQKGIHARFESVLLERQIKAEELKTQFVAPISDPVAAAFGWARASLRRSVDILKADKEAVAQDAAYGETYYRAFGERTRPTALQCLEESGRDLASIWHSAWRAAGKPELPVPADFH